MKINAKILIPVITSVVIIGSTPVNASTDSIGKVSSVKVKNDNRTYKGIIKSKPIKYGKVKYKYGIKASWKKVKYANGYEIYAYGVASKKWRKVKNTKKTSFVFTNLLGKDKFKFKVRAYKKVNNQKIYGKWSKIKKIKTSELMTKTTNGGHTKKKYYERYAAEQAFELQNQYRKQAGVELLTWSETLYEICRVRAKEITTDYSHSGFLETSDKILTEKYGLKELSVKTSEKDGFSYYTPLAAGENIAKNLSSYKDVMEGWKESEGHYRNIKKKEYNDGAIACYVIGGRTYWVAIFGAGNLDEIIKTDK